MLFEWDDHKNRLNQQKHGMAFELAYEFDWGGALIREDARRDYGERRFRALGFIGEKSCSITFVDIEGGVRVISLRRAHMKEVRQWKRDL